MPGKEVFCFYSRESKQMPDLQLSQRSEAVRFQSQGLHRCAREFPPSCRKLSRDFVWNVDSDSNAHNVSGDQDSTGPFEERRFKRDSIDRRILDSRRRRNQLRPQALLQVVDVSASKKGIFPVSISTSG